MNVKRINGIGSWVSDGLAPEQAVKQVRDRGLTLLFFTPIVLIMTVTVTVMTVLLVGTKVNALTYYGLTGITLIPSIYWVYALLENYFELNHVEERLEVTHNS